MVSSQIDTGTVRGARQRVAYVLGVLVVEWINRHAMQFLGAVARCARWTGRVLRAICFHVGMDVGAFIGVLAIIGVITVVVVTPLGTALISYLLKLSLIVASILMVIFMSL